MGNRSRYIAITAAAAAAVAARRRARLRHAAEGMTDAILPSAVPTSAGDAADEGIGHAPGHRHLPGDDPDGVRWGRLRRHPRRMYGHKERYPYAKD